ncbi:hypothetical protein LE191_04150 [Janthinobacterium sp. HSC-3S05]|jgi:hypothetical protein|uniref:hypothetical protein n=1 Tax=Janthinobacterium lividum TaxID=29581 RepID=UPI001CD8DC3E|nr:hypothetical protein [Janthinobacterium lividum]MCA1859301.1 hypothetical protein [Janthinobacterium lividum]
MPDIISFAILCGIATIFTYLPHRIKELRDVLRIRNRVADLEEMVFGKPEINAEETNSSLATPTVRKPRARKVKP